MIAAALALLAQSASATLPPAVFDGECIYAPGLGDPRPGETRVTCNQVLSDPAGIEFRDSNWDARMMRFIGEWNSDRLTVRQIVPRSGSSIDVRGLCRTYYTQGEVSVIACTAVAGGRSWIANFKVSRI